MSTADTFSLVGVVHLLPLPAAPYGSPGLDAVLARALADAEAMVQGGLQTVIVENLGDAPFRATRTDPHVAAMMAVITARVRDLGLSVGVNVLRNDARAALGVAAATGAAFIRVNVLSGATWTDQGLIQSEAHDLLRYRRELGCPVKIWADVNVKHGVPAGERDVALLTRDLAHRGGADGLIVTGSGTGAPTDLDEVRLVRAHAGGLPVWVGSGVTPQTLPAVRAACDGAIVGTWLHRDGRLDLPVDPDRVQALVEA